MSQKKYIFSYLLTILSNFYRIMKYELNSAFYRFLRILSPSSSRLAKIGHGAKWKSKMGRQGEKLAEDEDHARWVRALHPAAHCASFATAWLIQRHLSD